MLDEETLAQLGGAPFLEQSRLEVLDVWVLKVSLVAAGSLCVFRYVEALGTSRMLIKQGKLV